MPFTAKDGFLAETNTGPSPSSRVLVAGLHDVGGAWSLQPWGPWRGVTPPHCSASEGVALPQTSLGERAGLARGGVCPAPRESRSSAASAALFTAAWTELLSVANQTRSELYLWLLLLTGPGKGTRQSGDAQHPCFCSLALPLLSLLCSLGPWCTFSTPASHPLLSVCLKPPWLRKTLLPRFLLATQLFEFQVLLSLQDFFTGLASPTEGILISVHFCSF